MSKPTQYLPRSCIPINGRREWPKKRRTFFKQSVTSQSGDLTFGTAAKRFDRRDMTR
jgi:hypothetical protein